MLAVATAGYVVFASAGFPETGFAARHSWVGCDPYQQPDGDPQAYCEPIGAGADDDLSYSAAIAIAPPALPEDLHSVVMSSPAEEDTGDRHRDVGALLPVAELRPGYTLAELCSAGIGDREYRCRTGNYSEIVNLADAGAASNAAAGYTISGRVLTSDGVGLDRVTVVASPERLDGKRVGDSNRLRFRTVTNSLGAYSLHGLPDGEYTIRSSPHGEYRSARIVARAGVDYADLVLPVDRAEAIEGQVFAATGEPLEGVTVLPILTGQASVLTDEDGRFRLPVTLKPTIRSIALRFQRPGYLEQTDEVSLASPGLESAAALDVVMHPVQSWTSLSGVVVSDTGEPLAGRTVELRLASARRAYSATTDELGRYTFSFVEAPADYRLLVLGGTDHKDYHQALSLAADTPDVDIVVDSYEFGTVTGQLVNLNGVPVPDFELVLRSAGSRRPNALISTDEHGNFEIAAAPAGDFVVASQSTPSIMVKGLHLNPGERLHLPLVLDWGQHEIRGIVVDAYNNPVPASRIVLQWSHETGGITTSATRRTAADTQGQFAFSNLGPGPHSLKIDAPGFRPVEIDHDLSRQGYVVTVRMN